MQPQLAPVQPPEAAVLALVSEALAHAWEDAEARCCASSYQTPSPFWNRTRYEEGQWTWSDGETYWFTPWCLPSAKVAYLNIERHHAEGMANRVLKHFGFGELFDE